MTLPDLYILPLPPFPLASLLTWTADLVHWVASAGIVVLGLAIVLCLYRIIRGPTLADRAAALDVVGVQLIGLVVLITMHTGSLLYGDGILVLSLLGFAGTIAVAQFVARPYVVRQGLGMSRQEKKQDVMRQAIADDPAADVPTADAPRPASEAEPEARDD